MAGEMLGENPAFDIGGTAGGEVDDDVKRFALIEGDLFGGECRVCVWQNYCEPAENDQPPPWSTCHLVSPCLTIQ
jgi:hypothetical protein